MAPTHEGISEFPGCEDDPAVGQLKFLKPMEAELATELSRIDGPRIGHGASGFCGVHFGGFLLGLALPFEERFVLARIGEQEVEQCNYPDGEQEPSDVDGHRHIRVQANYCQYDSG